MSRVLVTGASGNVGREVVRALLREGTAVRASDTGSERTRALFGDAVEHARLDFTDRATFAAAARGCDRLFLLRPPAIARIDATLAPFVDAARAEGVGHVVFLSVIGAERNTIVPHHRVESHLRSRGGDWTFLRPGFFAQNFGDAYRRDIVEDDRIYVPAGGGRAAFVDVRDVADIAALAFADPSAHRGRAYALTGPAAVSFDEAAHILSEVLGRDVRYEAASLAGYARHLRRRGAPWPRIAVQTILHAGLRLGQAERVEPTLEALLGRPGRSLREYVADHAACWRRTTEEAA
jgi:uncharacterized protein YbjT (DUF2867 family)